MPDLVARVRVDGGGVSQGLNQASSAVKRFGNDIKSTITGAFGGAALVSAVRKSIQEIDQIQDASEELDLPVEQIQAMKFAAEDASDSFDKLLAILTKIEDIQIDIIKGETANGKKGRQIMQKMGYGPDQLNTMNKLDFAKLLASDGMSRVDLNTMLGAKMANRFMPFRDNIKNVDANTTTGLASGRVKTKEDLAELDSQIASANSKVNNATRDVGNFFLYISTYILKLSEWITKFFDYSTFGLYSKFFSGELFAKLNKVGAKPTEEPFVPPKNTPLVSKEDIVGTRKSYTDSMLSVGNFLGQSTTSNMDVATNILIQAKITNEKLDTLIEKFVWLQTATPLRPDHPAAFAF